MVSEIKNPNELLSEIIKLKKGGEVRQQQDEAVAAINKAITKGQHLVIEAPTGAGKALALDTPILTVQGWSTMGELRVGDEVYDEQGNVVQVLKTHEVFVSEDTYRINFSNGESIVADKDHLWYTINDVSFVNSASDLTVDELRNIQQEITNLLEGGRDTAPVTAEDLHKVGIPQHVLSSVLPSVIPVRKNDGTDEYQLITVLELVYQQALNHLGTFKGVDHTMGVLSTEQIFRTQLDEFNIPAHAIPVLQKPLQRPSVLVEAKKLVAEHSTENKAHTLRTIRSTDESFVRNAAEILRSVGHNIGVRSNTNRQKETTWVIHFASDIKGLPTQSGKAVNTIVSVEKIGSVPVRCITVNSDSHMFLAGKSLIPTFNTLSYLIPIVFNGSKAVISTATKQLSEQIINNEIPFIRKSLHQVMPGKSFTAALLKGRDNYFCEAKGEEQNRVNGSAEALFEVEDIRETKKRVSSADTKKLAQEISSIMSWSEETKSGDRSDAPAVSDQVWRQFSSTTAECPGKMVCPFGESCFAEIARDKARTADIVVTNHAIVANDLQADESIMLGERDLFVFDETHELDKYLSSAWGTRLTKKMLKDAHTTFKTLPDLKSKDVDQIESMGKKFDGVLDNIEPGGIKETPELLGQLMQRIYAASASIVMDAQKLAKSESERESTKKVAAVVVKKATGLMDSATLILDDTVNTVRWVTETETEKAINAAPLRIGPQLQTALESRDAKMVATSATIRVGGSFDIPVHDLALNATNVPYETVALTTPFDYPNQAIMYIPDENTFPAPIGQDRFEHKESVKKEVGDLVQAMGGRALCLYTTRADATENAKYLRKRFPKMNILFQDDAPVKQLIEEFSADEKSVFVATMGMWHGLDVQGPSLSLVTIDKVPFKPMNDPLSKARQDYANDTGKNGFMDVYVADAIIMLAQGVGRLVRSSTDKGVVAIFDTRIVTKRYGDTIRRSLPAMKIFRAKDVVISAAQRLAKILDKK